VLKERKIRNFLAKRGGDILVFFWWSLVFELSISAPLTLHILHNSTVNPKNFLTMAETARMLGKYPLDMDSLSNRT